MERCVIAMGVVAMAASLTYAGAGVITLDFETEDDFITPLVNGQAISSPGSFGNIVNIDGFGVNNLGAAIFDSSLGGPNVGSQDPDLLVGLGNILILQSKTSPTQSLPGIFDAPNDAAQGGTFVFSFISAVEMLSIDLVDIDAGNHTLVTLMDGQGNSRIFDVPAGWTFDIHAQGPQGYGTLDLTSLAPQLGEGGQTATVFQDKGFDASGVVFMSVEMSGSGGLDNVAFTIVPTPGVATIMLTGAGLTIRRRRR